MKKVVPSSAVLLPENANLAFSGVLYDVYQWPQALFDGSETTFEMLKRADTVVAIAVVDNQIIVLEDENPHQGKRTTFPGGRVELDDPDILAAAKRETLEESGYSFKNWRLIKVTQPSNEIEWFVYIFIAWDVENKQELNLDGGERIRVSTMTFSELKDFIMHDDGVLGEDRDIFQDINSVEDLLNLPEFSGQIIER